MDIPPVMSSDQSRLDASSIRDITKKARSTPDWKGCADLGQDPAAAPRHAGRMDWQSRSFTHKASGNPPPDRDCSGRQIKTAKQPRRQLDDRQARITKRTQFGCLRRGINRASTLFKMIPNDQNSISPSIILRRNYQTG